MGSCSLTKRKIAAISIYLPKADEVKRILEAVVGTIDRVKIKYDDPILLVGGDFNNKNMSPVMNALPELKPLNAGATRGDTMLDEIYCNIDRSIVQKEILHPLCKEDGTESDHKIIAAGAKLPRAVRDRAKVFKFRPLTRKGTEEFKSLLLNTCLLYTSPSPRDLSTSRMPSSA